MFIYTFLTLSVISFWIELFLRIFNNSAESINDSIFTIIMYSINLIMSTL